MYIEQYTELGWAEREPMSQNGTGHSVSEWGFESGSLCLNPISQPLCYAGPSQSSSICTHVFITIKF